MTETLTEDTDYCVTLAGILADYWDMDASWSTDDHASFQSLFAAAPVGVFRVRPEGVIHDCNDRAAGMLGYSRHELLGTPLASMHPRSEGGSRKAARLFGRFQAGEGFCGEMVEMNHRDGRVLEVSVCSTPLFGNDGKLREGLSTIRPA